MQHSACVCRCVQHRSTVLQAAPEDELRLALGLQNYTSGKGKVELKDSSMRPIEIFMCSVVSLSYSTSRNLMCVQTWCHCYTYVPQLYLIVPPCSGEKDGIRRGFPLVVTVHQVRQTAPGVVAY